MQRAKGYDPELIEFPPLFQTPIRPLAMVRWLFGFIRGSLRWLALTAIVYHLFTPSLARFASLSIDDIGLLWLRNTVLMLIVIGGLHWWLYIRKAQGTEFKYESRWLATNRKSFLFNNQTRDNMFFSLVPGGCLAALYEAIMFRLYATESIPQLESLWAIVAMSYAMLWIGMAHFYLTHRLLHIDPLYEWFHALHHRNVNTGPWSGISMHPVEQALYLSVPFVFLVLPGSPFIVTFSLVMLTITPSVSHSGFDRLKLTERTNIGWGDYFHHLHHRYFEVNFGGATLPFDKWFGTFHDGSIEAHEEMKSRRRASAETDDTDSFTGGDSK